MKSVKEQTYTIKEVRENLDKYLDLSTKRLRARLKTAWGKQMPVARVNYHNAKAKV